MHNVTNESPGLLRQRKYNAVISRTSAFTRLFAVNTSTSIRKILRWMVIHFSSAMMGDFAMMSSVIVCTAWSPAALCLSNCN